MDEALNAEKCEITINWRGPEDKPHYTAVLAGEGRTAPVTHHPFRGFAVLDRSEMERVAELVRSTGSAPVAEEIDRESEANVGYHILIDCPGRSEAVFVGFGEEARSLFVRIGESIREELREPLRNILRRLGYHDLG